MLGGLWPRCLHTWLTCLAGCLPLARNTPVKPCRKPVASRRFPAEGGNWRAPQPAAPVDAMAGAAHGRVGAAPARRGGGSAARALALAGLLAASALAMVTWLAPAAALARGGALRLPATKPAVLRAVRRDGQRRLLSGRAGAGGGATAPRVALLAEASAESGAKPRIVFLGSPDLTAQKLTLAPREKNFQRANVCGLGDFGS